MTAGLVKGEGFAVDASIAAADASSQRAVDGGAVVGWKDPALGTRAVRECLQALDANELGVTSPKKLSLIDPMAFAVNSVPASSRPPVGTAGST